MHNQEIQVVDIISFLDDNVIAVFGQYEHIVIKNLREPKDVEEFTLDWINSTNLKKQELAEATKARVLLADKDVFFSESIQIQNKVLITVENPRLAISRIAQHFFLPKPLIGIHSSVNIQSEAIVSNTAFIGAGCVIGKCTIGNGTVIHPNVTIYDNVIIGNNCIIQAGAVIGTDGLGCQRLPDCTLVKFPHLGGVLIGNDVEIGANSQIARGVLSNTIIGNGVKINGLCFIAHNCKLDDNVWITGNSMLSGSVKVQRNVTIYSSVVIREHLTIGIGSTIGMGSVVTKDIPEGETWFGNPAKKKDE